MNEDDNNPNDVVTGATEVGDKDQLIAYFQDLTSIDDMGQCLELLETANWNLNDAVQNYFTNNDQQQFAAIGTTMTTTTRGPTVTNIGIDDDDDDVLLDDSSSHILAAQRLLNQTKSLPSVFSEPRRYLEFEIEYKNMKKMFRVSDADTVGFIKRVCESEFQIPYEQLSLKGWKDRDPSLISSNADQIKLKELNLPLKTTLYLFKKSEQAADNDEDIIIEKVTTPSKSASTKTAGAQFEQCTYDIFINITGIDSTAVAVEAPSTSRESENTTSKSSFQLKYESDKTFSKVKFDLTKLTKVAVKNQEWFWKMPVEEVEEHEEADVVLSDNLILISRAFDNKALWELKQHLYNLYSQKYSKSKRKDMFRLEFNVNTKQQQQESKQHANEEESMNNSDEIVLDDEDEDDLEFHFADTVSTDNRLKRKTLISDDYESENDAISQFIKEFSDRYGSLIPLFYIGSLESAINESLLLPVSDRKLLAIYLHSDNTVYSNIFCSKILCNEEIINFLSFNFVLWPWDLTLQKNEEYFNNLCTRYLGGSTVIHAIKQSKERLPALILLTRVRSNNEIICVCEADSTREQLMMNLIQYDEMFQQQRAKDLIEENQREERERIKRDQDKAYQASLDYDKAKRQKQEEELNRELALKREQEQLKLNAEKEFNNRKANYLSQLKAEPEVTTENSKLLTTIRVKELDGSMLQRRFYASDRLEELIYYLGSLGYFDNKYKMLTTWPRRDLGVAEAREKTFQELKLYPQETIILEERDDTAE